MVMQRDLFVIGATRSNKCKLDPGTWAVSVCQESVLLEDKNYSLNFSSCELYG